MAKKIDELARSEHVSFKEPFETTVRRWAGIAAQQLQDAYKTQKIYNGTNNPAYEVWSGRKKNIIERGSVDSRGRRSKGKRKQIDWGWFKENAYRKELAARNPSADYWFSTGASANATRVDVISAKSSIEDFLVEGEVRFRTTMQMYYAEMGVGANGRKQVRGKKGIKVDRDEPFSWKYRYAYDWVPVRGMTHRPSVKQQVYYLKKRMLRLGKAHFNFALNLWLRLSLEDMLDTESNKFTLPYGIKFIPERK